MGELGFAVCLDHSTKILEGGDLVTALLTIGCCDAA